MTPRTSTSTSSGTTAWPCRSVRSAISRHYRASEDKPRRDVVEHAQHQPEERAPVAASVAARSSSDAGVSSGSAHAGLGPEASLPLVSCICPTFNHPSHYHHLLERPSRPFCDKKGRTADRDPDPDQPRKATQRGGRLPSGLLPNVFLPHQPRPYSTVQPSPKRYANPYEVERRAHPAESPPPLRFAARRRSPPEYCIMRL